MFVSQQVQARVKAKLVECIAMLEKRYKITIPMPTLEYTGATGVAGSADYREWRIKLSAPLLMDPANVDEMINDTTPHELAHLVTFKVYPETMERGMPTFLRDGRIKRGKREVHGPRWQEVMWAMGVNPERCHNMKLSDDAVHKVAERPKRRTDEWTCSRCKFVLMLTPLKSERLRADPFAIYHRGCRGAKLIEGNHAAAPALTPAALVQQIGRAQLNVQDPLNLLPPATQPKVNAPIVRQIMTPPTGESKIDMCKKLYLKYSMLSRGEIIAKFVSEAGCTQAGAGTYYQTCKKAYG